jgi:hypothetical protein
MNDSEMQFWGCEILKQGCKTYQAKANFTNPTGKFSLLYIPRSCIFTNFEKGKKALSQAETPISDG